MSFTLCPLTSPTRRPTNPSVLFGCFPLAAAHSSQRLVRSSQRDGFWWIKWTEEKSFLFFFLVGCFIVVLSGPFRKAFLIDFVAKNSGETSERENLKLSSLEAVRKCRVKFAPLPLALRRPRRFVSPTLSLESRQTNTRSCRPSLTPLPGRSLKSRSPGGRKLNAPHFNLRD